MSHKPRRFDLSPDNFIAAVSGVLTADELGVYWALCLMVYSAAGPITYDPDRLKAFLRGTHMRTINAALNKLETIGKISRNGSELMVKGCQTPIETASERVRKANENGPKGGRPSSKTKEIDKPQGFDGENPTTTTISTTTSISTTTTTEEGVVVVDSFEAFFKEMPRSGNRISAKRAFDAAILKMDPNYLIASAKQYALKCKGFEDRYILTPAKWLDDERWTDFPPKNGRVRDPENEAFQQKMREKYGY